MPIVVQEVLEGQEVVRLTRFGLMFVLEHITTYHTDPLNRQSLDVIETGMFGVSLDKPYPQIASLEKGKPYSDTHTTILANGSLHGNGTEFNTGNRWFDTSVQVCVCVCDVCACTCA